MKFEINNLNWEIKELSQSEIKEIVNVRCNNNSEDVNNLERRYYGITYHDDMIIYLDKDLPQDRKKRTLIHELAHCYIGCYITHQEKTYDEEMIADIISNSNNIINKIVDKYFKN